ncbi:hypothetical protein CLOM_g3078 [Closterium sp. NIES-68]|nr:hypothetical protein CLOM_g3078 [Closterium sp. NIES-68]
MRTASAFAVLPVLLLLLHAALLSRHLASAAVATDGRRTIIGDANVADNSHRRQLEGPLVSHGPYHRQLWNPFGGLFKKPVKKPPPKTGVGKQAAAVACEGVQCPQGATCEADGSGFPFCKCDGGLALINGSCVTAVDGQAVATSLVLYAQEGFVPAPPAVLRGAIPNRTCVNLPASHAGAIGSLRILWGVKDGSAAPGRAVCGKVFFWDQPDCCCSGSGWEIPGGWKAANAAKLNYAPTSIQVTSGVVAAAQSMSCQAAADPAAATQPGTGVATGSTGSTGSTGGTSGGSSSGPCAATVCPANSVCAAQGTGATCNCVVGYSKVDGLCQAIDICSLVACPATCTCSSTNGIAKCSCPDACYGIKCPDVSTCVVQSGTPVCKCPAPFVRLIDGKCSSAALLHSDYLDVHNAARAAVGAVPLVWDDAVAAHAQAWATTLTNSTYNCGLSHGGNPGEGQNLSGASPSGWATPSDAARWWVNEGQWYSPAVFPDGCEGGSWCKCGHYTQVVWNSTRKVGCGKASCGTAGDVWACNYYPPGNYMGQMPYVPDPCFRVLCPSTATCSAVNGQPTCVCAPGQVLVNNAQCQTDPCKGVSCPAGDLVCDGSTGTAQCVCPKGLLLVAPNTCLAPSCVGVDCPSTARCRASSGGIPFCACPASSSLVNASCIQAAPATVASSVTLFNAPSFANSPASLAPIVLRAPTPGAGCVNIPAAVAGAVGSLQILWDAPDGAAGTRQVCRLMWFWNGANCYGHATGWGRPTSNVTTAASTSGDVAALRAISCAA